MQGGLSPSYAGWPLSLFFGSSEEGEAVEGWDSYYGRLGLWCATVASSPTEGSVGRPEDLKFDVYLVDSPLSGRPPPPPPHLSQRPLCALGICSVAYLDVQNSAKEMAAWHI